jgi:hypothetical protein
MSCKVYVLDNTLIRKPPLQRGSDGTRRGLFWVLKSKVNTMELCDRRKVVATLWGQPAPEPNHFRRYGSNPTDVYSSVDTMFIK